jgi:hypothetical protein
VDTPSRKCRYHRSTRAADTDRRCHIRYQGEAGFRWNRRMRRAHPNHRRHQLAPRHRVRRPCMRRRSRRSRQQGFQCWPHPSMARIHRTRQLLNRLLPRRRRHRPPRHRSLSRQPFLPSRSRPPLHRPAQRRRRLHQRRRLLPLTRRFRNRSERTGSRRSPRPQSTS